MNVDDIPPSSTPNRIVNGYDARARPYLVHTRHLRIRDSNYSLDIIATRIDPSGHLSTKYACPSRFLEYGYYFKNPHYLPFIPSEQTL